MRMNHSMEPRSGAGARAAGGFGVRSRTASESLRGAVPSAMAAVPLPAGQPGRDREAAPLLRSRQDRLVLRSTFSATAASSRCRRHNSWSCTRWSNPRPRTTRPCCCTLATLSTLADAWPVGRPSSTSRSRRSSLPSAVGPATTTRRGAPIPPFRTWPRSGRSANMRTASLRGAGRRPTVRISASHQDAAALRLGADARWALRDRGVVQRPRRWPARAVANRLAHRGARGLHRSIGRAS